MLRCSGPDTRDTAKLALNGAEIWVRVLRNLQAHVADVHPCYRSPVGEGKHQRG